MVTKKVAVLYGHGINCQLETRRALLKAASRSGLNDKIRIELVHNNQLFGQPEKLEAYQMLVIPGGFLHGDDIAAGQILANQFRARLSTQLEKFISEGNLLLGICNGFQVLAKYPLLSSERTFTLTWNDSGRFEDRWAHLNVEEENSCVFLQGINRMYLPIRHAEGKFLADPSTLGKLEKKGQLVLRYRKPDGTPAEGKFPHNPNGSMNDVAGVSDPSGRILGLMPHPEAFINFHQHPQWGARKRKDGPHRDEDGEGLKVFQNGLEYIAKEL